MTDTHHPSTSTSTPARISVVIVCHNYGQFLREAVQSVLGQSRRADEITIIDDSSNDETSAIAMEFARSHHRIRLLTNHERLGVVRTYNKGVRATTGDLIVILDADDRLSKNYLEELERELLASGRDFAYAGEVFFGAVSGIRRVHPWDRDALAMRNYVNTAAMFRRSIFVATGGFSPWFERLGHEDWEFWIRATAEGAEGVAVATCWLEYRRHVRGSRGDLSRLKDLIAHLLIHIRVPEMVPFTNVIRRARHRGSDNSWPILQSDQIGSATQPY